MPVAIITMTAIVVWVMQYGIKGTGHFAGLSMGVALGGASGCWTEGEPKIYIDGEEYPSINYTGFEDYFGGSFNFSDCDPAIRQGVTIM